MVMMNRVANHVDVVSHLMFPNQEEGDLGERVMSQEDAEVLVKRYKTILEQGIRRGSYTYHVVDQILQHEKSDQMGKIFRHDEAWWFESSNHSKYIVKKHLLRLWLLEGMRIRTQGLLCWQMARLLSLLWNIKMKTKAKLHWTANGKTCPCDCW
jgi:hypothetical protein